MDARIKRLGKNTFFVFLGNAGSAVIGMVMLPFYTRLLSTTEYGTSDIINTYALILHSFVSCCIAESIFVYPKNEIEENKIKYFSSGFLFAIFSFGICALLFSIISLGDRNNCYLGSFSQNIWWIWGITGSNFLKNYYQQFTRSIDKMKVYSMAGVVHAVSLALFAFILLPLYGLSGYLWSLVLSNIVTAVYSLLSSGAYKYFKIGGYDKDYLYKLLQYGVPLIPNSLMWWLVNGVNRPFIEANLGLAALGIFAVASKFPALLYTLYSIFNNAWGITIIEEFGKPDFNAFFNKMINYIFLLILICGCFIISSSKLIILLFAAPEYFEAWRYMPVLTLSFILQSFSGMIGGVFMGEKKSKFFFYSSIYGAITSLLLTYLSIHLFGLMGAPIAMAGAFLVMSLVRLKYAWKYINLFSTKKYIASFLIYICFIALFTADISLFVSISAFFIAILLLLVINKQETNIIMKRLAALKNK